MHFTLDRYFILWYTAKPPRREHKRREPRRRPRSGARLFARREVGGDAANGGRVANVWQAQTERESRGAGTLSSEEEATKTKAITKNEPTTTGAVPRRFKATCAKVDHFAKWISVCRPLFPLRDNVSFAKLRNVRESRQPRGALCRVEAANDHQEDNDGRSARNYVMFLCPVATVGEPVAELPTEPPPTAWRVVPRRRRTAREGRSGGGGLKQLRNVSIL